MSKLEGKLNFYKGILTKPMILRRDNNKTFTNLRMMSDSKKKIMMMQR